MFLTMFFPSLPAHASVSTLQEKFFLESTAQNSDKISTWDLQDLYSFVNQKWAVANCALYFAF